MGDMESAEFGTGYPPEPSQEPSYGSPPASQQRRREQTQAFKAGHGTRLEPGAKKAAAEKAAAEKKAADKAAAKEARAAKDAAKQAKEAGGSAKKKRRGAGGVARDSREGSPVAEIELPSLIAGKIAGKAAGNGKEPMSDDEGGAGKFKYDLDYKKIEYQELTEAQVDALVSANKKANKFALFKPKRAVTWEKTLNLLENIAEDDHREFFRVPPRVRLSAEHKSKIVAATRLYKQMFHPDRNKDLEPEYKVRGVDVLKKVQVAHDALMTEIHPVIEDLDALLSAALEQASPPAAGQVLAAPDGGAEADVARDLGPAMAGEVAEADVARDLGPAMAGEVAAAGGAAAAGAFDSQETVAGAESVPRAPSLDRVSESEDEAVHASALAPPSAGRASGGRSEVQHEKKAADAAKEAAIAAALRTDVAAAVFNAAKEAATAAAVRTDVAAADAEPLIASPLLAAAASLAESEMDTQRAEALLAEEAARLGSARDVEAEMDAQRAALLAEEATARRARLASAPRVSAGGGSGSRLVDLRPPPPVPAAVVGPAPVPAAVVGGQRQPKKRKRPEYPGFRKQASEKRAERLAKAHKKEAQRKRFKAARDACRMRAHWLTLTEAEILELSGNWDETLAEHVDLAARLVLNKANASRTGDRRAMQTAADKWTEHNEVHDHFIFVTNFAKGDMAGLCADHKWCYKEYTNLLATEKEEWLVLDEEDQEEDEDE